MGLYSSFKTDNVAEREGKWFDLVNFPNKDGTVPGFLMARMHENNPAYLTAMERISKDMQQAITLDALTEETARPVMRKVFVDVVLLNWRNVYLDDEQSDALVYTKAAADQLMTELPDLYQLLTTEAKKLGNFKQLQLEETAKKSQQPLSKPSGKDDI